ncbi:MAG TPA: hypothetical protein PK114_09115 [Smithellaceae bacterium]|nr:hypothetical protein [Smithellaceae bacterium]
MIKRLNYGNKGTNACKSGAVFAAFRGFEDRKALARLSRSAGARTDKN